jgi:hypothetical protein
MKSQYRNLHPTAAARIAMIIWGKEYSEQRGGSMDFFDSLSPDARHRCELAVEDLQAEIGKPLRTHGSRPVSCPGARRARRRTGKGGYNSAHGSTNGSAIRGDERKHDQSKPMRDLLPFDQVGEIVKVLIFGAGKYDRESWKNTPDGTNRYFAALLRHLVAWRSGEVTDPESGLSHLAHAGACLLFLAWFDDHGRRPKP